MKNNIEWILLIAKSDVNNWKKVTDTSVSKRDCDSSDSKLDCNQTVSHVLIIVTSNDVTIKPGEWHVYYSVQTNHVLVITVQNNRSGKIGYKIGWCIIRTAVKLQNTGLLIYILLNHNSAYCDILRSSKGFDM